MQKLLFTELNEVEQKVASLLGGSEKIHIDLLAHSLDMPVRKVSSLLLELECKGMVLSLPGNHYRLR